MSVHSRHFYSRLFISIVLLGLYIKGLCDFLNFLTPPHLLLAAGKNTGESYIISKAIAKVVQKEAGIEIEVCTTDGTEQNLELLRTGQVQLATAQADYANENISSSISKDSTSNAQYTNSCPPLTTNSLEDPLKPNTVAVLYKDFFQLFVNKFSGIQDLNQLKSRDFTVNVPEQGGQFWSFKKLLEHYGIEEKELDKINPDESDISEITSCDALKADVVFRVRALDNQDINNLVKHDCGKLLPIKQADAMKVKHPAFNPAQIPTGTYAAEPPEPNAGEKGLDTVAVSRLLLTSENVPNNTIEKITRKIFENRRDIRDAIDEIQKEDSKKLDYRLDYQYVKPLIEKISPPPSNTTNQNNQDNQEISIPTHPGAIAFYNQDNNIWKKLNDNGNALNLFVALVAVTPVVWALLSWWRQRPQKIVVDEYINQANELIKNKIDVESMQNELDKLFNQAVESLRKNKISQESFRTFNEAYKTIREAIERERQVELQAEKDKRKNQANIYINTVTELMNKDKGSTDDRQRDLDQVFNQAVEALRRNKISQELFRTFNEAYKTTREAIVRERQVELQAEGLKRKNQADKYIDAAIKLINKNEGDVESRQKRLDEEFNKAAKALIDESISQELFRTFNETYKTAREAIEHERQLAEQDKAQEQRKTAESYVGAAVEVLRDETQSQDLLFKKLDTIFQEVVTELTQQKISEESFRTFLEAYKTTRDVIERRSN